MGARTFQFEQEFARYVGAATEAVSYLGAPVAGAYRPETMNIDAAGAAGA